MIVRAPLLAECEALFDLCLRSKAHWGYDDAFLAACREELTVTGAMMQSSAMAVAECDGVVYGLVQLDLTPSEAVLEKIFVVPEAIGTGIGKALFRWAVMAAKDTGAGSFTIDSDPNAVAFYRHMGAVLIGSSPSGSIAGRLLPKLRYVIDLTI
uniref:GNAT family N-acetyltransferase n=1 Tax=Pararhizobium sp. IMCC3301 TaxID=3067904 RepID=UPI0027419512|nr:GNAT family N-acetyltransferase [Pararhizobium sp. IMCC3301]